MLACRAPVLRAAATSLATATPEPAPATFPATVAACACYCLRLLRLGPRNAPATLLDGANVASGGTQRPCNAPGRCNCCFYAYCANGSPGPFRATGPQRDLAPHLAA